MASKDKLKEYKEKRDFSKTIEPAGDGSKTKKNIFVIQKHKASNLHYDFRLEIDGVLKSWAVPKGVSTDKDEKRLALLTEDHPLEYADFEGVIPEGEYGAGTVIVWDGGKYENIRKDKDKLSMSECFKDGKIEVSLEGKKLKGGYVLINTGDKKRWLLKKMDDEEADARRKPVKTQPESILSGKTVDEIEDEMGKS